MIEKDRFGNLFQAVLWTAFFKVASRMNQVDQVTVMGQDVIRIDTDIVTDFLECLDTFLRQRFCLPPLLILDK